MKLNKWQIEFLKNVGDAPLMINCRRKAGDRKTYNEMREELRKAFIEKFAD